MAITALDRRAHRIMWNAVRHHGFKLSDTCEQCGTSEKLIHAHHDDYTKPLDVRWLCVSCHGKHHAALRREAKLRSEKSEAA